MFTCIRNRKLITGISLLIVIFMLFYFIYEICDMFGEMKYESYLSTHYGQTKVVCGSAVFVGSPKILVANNEPILKVAVYKDWILKEKLLIDFIIFDVSGRIVAEIKNNHWVINENNYFRLVVAKNEIKVINELNEIELDCIALPNGAIKVNGTFYINGLRIVVTDTELKINT